MTFEELLTFITLEDQRLKDNFENYPDTGKRALARAVKLSEETGELCSEILSFNSMQRQEKMESYSRDNLAHEFADVIITALLLAKTTNIDVKDALRKKIEKINARYKS